MSLYVGPQPAGWTPKALVNAPNFQSSIEQNAFDKVDYGRMKIIEELPVGNIEGRRPADGGEQGGRGRGRDAEQGPRLPRLRGGPEGAPLRLGGHPHRRRDGRRRLQEAAEGADGRGRVHRHVRLGAGAARHSRGRRPTSQDRGSYADEEKEIHPHGLRGREAQGPGAPLVRVREHGGNLRLAWEKRSDDKTAYLYFDVQSWPAEGGPGRSATGTWGRSRSARASGWSTPARPTRSARARTPWFKSRFSKGRGLGYEFAGYLGELPYTEYGYVVEYKKYVYSIRIQLGGKDAEKIFSKDLKALKKAHQVRQS